MVIGKIHQGAEFEIAEDALDDMELLELITEADANQNLLPKVVLSLFGADQKKKLYDILREEHGKVRISDVGVAIQEVLLSISEGKN